MAEETSAAPTPARGGRRKWWAILLVVVILAGAGGYYFWSQSGGPAESGPAQKASLYYALDPQLIVNFKGGGRVRYLQLGIQLMTHDPDAIEALKKQSPIIRNNLILLLSDVSYKDLLTKAGKVALRKETLETVQKVMQKHYGSPAVEAVYFTRFVMQ